MGCDPYRKYLNHRPKRMGAKVEAKDIPARELGTQGSHLEGDDPVLDDDQKLALIEALFAAWLEHPNQRFGQLIVNALITARAGSLYHVSDSLLVEVVTAFGKTIDRAETTLASR